MKEILVYWVIGCVLVGWADGKIHEECGTRINSQELFVGVAFWPAHVVAAMVDDTPPKECSTVESQDPASQESD